LPHPVGAIFLLFFGMFILLTTLKVDPFSSAVAAFGFMLCTYYFTVMEAGHNSKVNAVAYMPLVLSGVLMLYRGRFWLGSAITMLAMGLELNANHVQITYYGFFIIGAIVVSELIRNSNAAGKAIAWVGILGIFTSWALHLPRAVWIAGILATIAIPVIMKALSLRGKGNSIKAWLTGRELPAEARPVRTFVLATILMGLCMGISISPNISRILTNKEYVAETMRGGPVHSRASNPDKSGEKGGLSKTYAYTWSYGVAESFTIINPFYFGDAVQAKLGQESATFDVLKSHLNPQGAEQLADIWPSYIGDQPMHSGPTYMGVVVCFLFVLGLVVVPTRHRWWLLGATIVSVMLSWGRNFQWFSDLFFDNLPLYNNFRAVSMWLTITSICISIMGGLALAAVFREGERRTERQQAMRIGIAAGATIFLLLILAWFHPGSEVRQPDDAQRIAGFLSQVGLKDPDPGMVADLVDALATDRSEMISSQAYKGILLVILAAGALIGYVMLRKNLSSREMRPVGIGAVCLILFGLVYWDLVPVDKRYLNDQSFVRASDQMAYFKPSACDAAIRQDPDPNYRVFNLTGNSWNDAMTSYHHKSIGGYSAAKLQRYQDLIDFRFDTERQRILEALNTRDSMQMKRILEALQAATALNMLNCKYMILDKGSRPLLNASAMGHAWIVGGYEVVDGPDQAMARLEGLDLRAKLIVEQSSDEQLNGFQASADPSATVALKSWQSNEIHYQFASTGGKEQLVVFSEVYYNSGKGWKAYIDGQPAGHFRCNYVLRGMKVPSGNHEIVFKMEPQSYRMGETLALVFSLLLFAIAAGSVYMDYKTGGKDDETTDGAPASRKA
ncbi:MAG: hypothetical protein RLZZ165_1782, partial [Bacteroidota bacterium]